MTCHSTKLNPAHIATLVERSSRYTKLAQLDGKDTESVIQAITREMIKLPSHFKKNDNLGQRDEDG